MRFFLISSIFIFAIFAGGCVDNTVEVSVNTDSNKSMNLARSYTDLETGMFFSFPENWRTFKDKNNVVKILTLESVAKPTKLEDQQTEIELRIKNNPDNLSIEGFYDGINDKNFFLDANNGTEEINVGGYNSVKFINVSGIVPADIVVIPVKDKLFEFKLNDLRYKDVFSTILTSVKFNN